MSSGPAALALLPAVVDGHRALRCGHQPLLTLQVLHVATASTEPQSSASPRWSRKRVCSLPWAKPRARSNLDMAANPWQAASN